MMETPTFDLEARKREMEFNANFKIGQMMALFEMVLECDSKNIPLPEYLKESINKMLEI